MSMLCMLMLVESGIHYFGNWNPYFTSNMSMEFSSSQPPYYIVSTLTGPIWYLEMKETYTYTLHPKEQITGMLACLTCQWNPWFTLTA